MFLFTVLYQNVLLWFSAQDLVKNLCKKDRPRAADGIGDAEVDDGGALERPEGRPGRAPAASRPSVVLKLQPSIRFFSTCQILESLPQTSKSTCEIEVLGTFTILNTSPAQQCTSNNWSNEWYIGTSVVTYLEPEWVSSR